MTSPNRSCAVNLVAEQPADAPLVVLDGMSLAFRAFFALSPEIATSNGVTTNALHGFAAMLHSLVRTQRPRALAVAFDLPGGTFRDAMSEDYKGGRAATPPELAIFLRLQRGLGHQRANPRVVEGVVPHHHLLFEHVQALPRRRQAPLHVFQPSTNQTNPHE